MRVLALDPGDKVGWARADVADDGSWIDLRHGITPLRDMALAIAESLDIAYGWNGYDDCKSHTNYDLIVIEDWRLYPQMAKTMVGSSFPSVQFIGMVKLCCWLSSTKLVTQGASIKTTADKTMAKLRPELYEMVTQSLAHDSAHDLDAIRHLWFHTWKQVYASHE
jgi:hypothetical protein